MSKEGSILSTSLQNKSVVENIIDKIISAIIAGELAPGDQLPTEIELCRDLGVGRNSVREAIKKLEAYGVVYKAGGGNLCQRDIQPEDAGSHALRPDSSEEELGRFNRP